MKDIDPRAMTAAKRVKELRGLGTIESFACVIEEAYASPDPVKEQMAELIVEALDARQQQICQEHHSHVPSWEALDELMKHDGVLTRLHRALAAYDQEAQR